MKFLNNNTKQISKKAFSLLELSIVILIVSILITGALSISTVSSEQENIRITKERMDTIYKAIGSFVLANGRLPCPAGINLIKSSSINYGAEASNTPGNCSSQNTTTFGTVYQSSANLNVYYGMVPVKSLGISIDFAEDGFGTKIGYVVNQYLTASGASGFGVATVPFGFIAVDAVSLGGANNLTGEAAFAFISYGKNKSGGFNSNSSSQNTNPSSVDSVQELSNSPTGSSGSFDKWFAFSHEGNDLFDDIVFFKTRNQIVVDFDAFSKVFCPAYNETLYGITINWPTSSYGQIASSCSSSITGDCSPDTTDNPCPVTHRKGPNLYPTRRCESLGTWGPIINPCLN